MSEYLEKRIEALVAAGRLTDQQIDKAVSKGLLRQEKAAAVKSKKPKGGVGKP
jgi:ribosomal protein S20